ncbi:MAG: PP2C family protein-serine/threonine phosphatase [Planctomycetaceae bacterium]|jgi:serine/threonine protein phosphatase PrpC
MHWEQKVAFAALSDIGFRRRNNQDSYCIQIAPDPESWERNGHLFLVADGMGGHAVGELASKMAADTVPHAYTKLSDESVEGALKRALEMGNDAIHERGELNREFTRMGTTCTALVLGPQGAVVGHVGDSRCYRIRKGRIDQLTFDHSLQWELMRQGVMSPEDILRTEPRNVITRSLGPNPSVDVDVEGPHAIESHDVYLLCSDGLTGQVPDPEIGAMAANLTPAEACRALVNLANLRGGPDNITVVIARVGAGLGPDESAAVETASPARSLAWIHPGELAAATGIVAGFVLGLLLLSTDYGVAGHLLMATANVCLGVLLLLWLRRRRREGELASQIPSMVKGGPYRSAKCGLSSHFLSDLSNLQATVQRTAQEDGWLVDWAPYHAVREQALADLAARRSRDALRNLTRGLQYLMEGIQQLRRQRDQAQKWGTKSSPPGDGAPPSA